MTNKHQAEVFADCSIYFFSQGNLRLAVKYWNKIYDLNLPIPDHLSVMRKFTDDQVYAITDRIRNGYYRGVGLI